MLVGRQQLLLQKLFYDTAKNFSEWLVTFLGRQINNYNLEWNKTHNRGIMIIDTIKDLECNMGTDSLFLQIIYNDLIRLWFLKYSFHCIALIYLLVSQPMIQPMIHPLHMNKCRSLNNFIQLLCLYLFPICFSFFQFGNSTAEKLDYLPSPSWS